MNTPHEERGPSVGYERTDVSSGPFLAAFTLAVGVSLVAIFLWVLLDFFARVEPKPIVSPFFAQKWQPVGPGLETSRTYDLPEVRRRENENLYSYRWIDKQHGIVQIPIDRAIEVATEHGFSDWGAKSNTGTTKASQEGGH